MTCCELSLPSPEENLACDEVLLDRSEEQGGALLRLWEPTQYFVVVGYGNRVLEEVKTDFCEANDIPVLRRLSGGGTVLQGPGVLNYSLILPIREHTATISGTNTFILEKHAAALVSVLKAPVQRSGQTDLAVGGLKFCGNAQRRQKRFLLFHGSFLLHADIGMIEKTIRLPKRQPEYRLHRSHTDFLMNLKVPAALIKEALRHHWNADGEISEVPFDAIQALARQKYQAASWNHKF